MSHLPFFDDDREVDGAMGAIAWAVGAVALALVVAGLLYARFGR